VQEIIKLVSTIRNDISDLRSLLTHFSMTHAQLISEEWITADQVMQILKISIRTAETHRSRLIHKLGLKTTAALVKYALAKGLI